MLAQDGVLIARYFGSTLSSTTAEIAPMLERALKSVVSTRGDAAGSMGARMASQFVSKNNASNSKAGTPGRGVSTQPPSRDTAQRMKEPTMLIRATDSVRFQKLLG